MYDSAYCGTGDPKETKVDMERLGITPKEKKKVRVPKIEIITKGDLEKLQHGVNTFLASVCMKDGFEFNDFRYCKQDGFAYISYVGVVSYSYLEDMDKVKEEGNGI